MLRSFIMSEYSISQDFEERFPSESDEVRSMKYCKGTVRSFQLCLIDNKIKEITQKLGECDPENEISFLKEKENLEEIKRELRRELIN